jgi:hypothetical protein
MHKCQCCKLEKPAEMFNKNRSRKSGLSHYCKQCIYVRNKNEQVDHAKHYAKNANYYKMKAMFRKDSVKRATPPWLSPEQKSQIEFVYSHAKDCQIVTGEVYHVDHIVPLQGEAVCGLHVPWNLQVLPAEVNVRKSNRYEEAE